MSYDVSLRAPRDVCEHCGRGDEPRELFSRNHTSNTCRMWYECLRPYTDQGLRGFNGMKAEELIAPLAQGIRDMEQRAAHYAQWNSTNGWGSYESTRSFLRAILGACRRNPDAVIEVSS